MSEVGGGSV